MQTFKAARFKLTLYYTLILLAITSSFSGIYYWRTSSLMAFQIQRIEQRFKQAEFGPKAKLRSMIFRSELQLAKQQLKKSLVLINGLILVLGGVGSYLLSGKTLEPIRRALQAQQQFVADAAHELKTPITALKTSLEVSLLNKQLSASFRQILEDNLEAVSALSSLVQDLLSLARLDGQTSLYDQRLLKSVELSSLLKSVLKQVEPLARKKKIKLKLVGQAGYGQLKACCRSLEQMLVILLDNAIKFSQPGQTVKLKVEQTKQQLIFQVIDRGCGISQQDLPKIFDRFYQADQARSKQGYGLGLALAQKIVKQHKGQLLVESKINRGSVFKVVLPKK